MSRRLGHYCKVGGACQAEQGQTVSDLEVLALPWQWEVTVTAPEVSTGIHFFG